MWDIEMGGAYIANNGNSYFTRKIYTNVSGIADVRKKFNNKDVYATIMAYEDISDQNNTNMIGQMYIDLDRDLCSETDYKGLVRDLLIIVTYLNLNYKIPEEYIKFYFTGQKGFHLMISPEVFGAVPNKKLNLVYKEIAKDVNSVTVGKPVDLKIYDTKRLFRLVNSVNSKSGRYKVPVTLEQIRNYSHKTMLEYATSPKEVLKSIPVSKVEVAAQRYESILEKVSKVSEKKFIIPTDIDLDKITFPPCIQYLYNSGVSSGNRNTSTVVLASVFFQKGIDLDTTMAMLKQWNAEKNVPALSEGEMETTIKSAYDLTMSGRRYGCGAIKDLGYCEPDSCSIIKKQ